MALWNIALYTYAAQQQLPYRVFWLALYPFNKISHLFARLEYQYNTEKRLIASRPRSIKLQ